ncbi:MAG: ATP-grasp domain-containing protein [Chloroflexi bacterium]|nr:ATP-grasp domain-containing protein [Chloroflexota bacterium]
MSDRPVTILCLASYFKGTTFLTAAKAMGCRVLLVTREKLADEPWPREAIDQIFFMPDLAKQPDMTYAIAYLMRGKAVDQIVPLDDYDVLPAAELREHFRLPGLGLTNGRYFRDKLAMRTQARRVGLPVPEFTPIFNYDDLRAFMARVAPPWVIKPRAEAGAMGIKKVYSSEEVWRWLDRLGDAQSYFLLEQFVPGRVYHVDSIVSGGEVVLAVPHEYAQPPLNVAHEGGVFVTRTIRRDSADAQAILDLNRQMITGFGMAQGVAHTEFIRAEDGRFYFLETAARVGGANIEELVAAAAGVNLWAEWVRLEMAYTLGEPYPIPADKGAYAGVLICLARQEWPDLSGYQDSEIVFRLRKKHHAGLIVASADNDRVEALVAAYAQRFADDFLATAPPLDKPPA